jgi:hypothetical protein
MKSLAQSSIHTAMASGSRHITITVALTELASRSFPAKVHQEKKIAIKKNPTVWNSISNSLFHPYSW